MKRFKAIINSYIALFIYLFTKKKDNIWLIGGSSGNLYTDNSKAFYEYILSQQPNIKIYWMVNKNSPSNNDIKGEKIEIGSVRGYLYFLYAKVVIFSHTLNSDIAPYSFILPCIRLFYLKKMKVYIGHGTVSFKKMPKFKGFKGYIKNKIFQSYNLAIASTELEVKVMQEYGIKKENIVLFGSARYDNLKNIDSNKNIILITPTWRPWLYNSKNITTSNFYKIYSSLLKNREFNNLLNKYSIKVKFYLHHMFHQYIKDFKQLESKNISILSENSNISKEIQKAKTMITDYSSICADFYYLQKPIIFFQFDLEEYIDKIGSEIDLKNDTFGDVVYTVDDLIKKVESTVKNGYKITNKQKMGEKFFVTNKNSNASQQIYLEIIKRI